MCLPDDHGQILQSRPQGNKFIYLFIFTNLSLLEENLNISLTSHHLSALLTHPSILLRVDMYYSFSQKYLLSVYHVPGMVQASVKIMANISFFLELIIHLLYGKHHAITLENNYRERDMVLIPKELKVYWWVTASI